MGITDTFDCLNDLPHEVRLALCAAALSERNGVLQAAAVRALLDQAGLDRPGVVVDRFDSLLPDAVKVAAEQREDLVSLACARVREDSHPERLASYALLVALGGDECLELLERAMVDDCEAVREVAFAAVEDRLRAHCQDARSPGSDEPLPQPGVELWHAAHVMIRAIGHIRRSRFVALVGEFGAVAVPLIHQVVRNQRNSELAESIARGLLRSSPRPCAELVMALATHQGERTRAVGDLVLDSRADVGFADSMASLLVDMGAARRSVLPSSLLPRAIGVAAGALNVDAALDVLRIANAETDDPEVRQPLFERFLSNDSAHVQCEALRALEALRFPKGHAVLATVLREASDEVRGFAAEVALRLRPGDLAALLTPLLGSLDPQLRELAQREVLQVSMPQLFDRFESMDPRAREVAAGALSKIDPHFVARLGKEFLSLDGARRLKALQVVELVHAEADLHGPLLEMLEDPDLRVRATAIRVVEATASVEGIKILIDTLSHPDRRLRANAIEAFEEMDDPAHVDLIRPFLRDRDNRVRANAAKALCNLGCVEGRDTLCAMMTHEEEMMRISAAWAIGELRFDEGRALLETRERLETNTSVLAKIREVLATFSGIPGEAR